MRTFFASRDTHFVLGFPRNLSRAMNSNDIPNNSETDRAPQEGEIEHSTALELKSSPKSGGVQKPRQTLPSDRLSFERQIDSLKAFASQAMVHDGVVTNKQAGDVVGVAETTIVVTNAFFTEIGLLERIGNGQFRTNSLMSEYAHAIDYQAPSPGHALKPLFEKQWFAKTLLPYLGARDVSRDEAVRILAQSCGASKKYEGNVRVLLDFMGYVGVVEFLGDLVKKSASANPLFMQQNGDSKSPVADEPDKVASEDHMIPKDAPFLFLDKKRERKVTLIAPDSLTSSEVNKIKSWLELVLYVEEDKI